VVFLAVTLEILILVRKRGERFDPYSTGSLERTTSLNRRQSNAMKKAEGFLTNPKKHLELQETSRTPTIVLSCLSVLIESSRMRDHARSLAARVQERNCFPTLMWSPPCFFNQDLLNLRCYYMWFPESYWRGVSSILLHHSMIVISEVLLHDPNSFLRL
jgi:hypothetical protein